MLSFKQWCEQAMPKKWHMSRPEAIQYWRSLQPNMPMNTLRPIPEDHKGSTYAYDGVRITGSQQFITTIMSRLKDLLNFEGANSKLNITFQQQVDAKTSIVRPSSYVLYVQVQDRNPSELPDVQ